MCAFLFKVKPFFFLCLSPYSFSHPLCQTQGLQAVFTNWHVSFCFHSVRVHHPHTLYHIGSEMHLLSFSNFNIAEIAICLTILDLMKYGMHIYIWEPFPFTLCIIKNVILFYILFCIFLSLLLCGNPFKKSDKTLILFKHVLCSHYSTSDGPLFFS